MRINQMNCAFNKSSGFFLTIFPETTNEEIKEIDNANNDIATKLNGLIFTTKFPPVEEDIIKDKPSAISSSSITDKINEKKQFKKT